MKTAWTVLAVLAQEEYEGHNMTLADTRPFKAWFEKNVGEWKDDALGMAAVFG